MVDMISVDSSNIESVGRDGDSVFVKFANGGTYEYAGVPEAVWDDFVTSPSKGKFVHAVLKKMATGRKVEEGRLAE